jgi:uncharacterized membrane protein (UPF0136 family)
MAASAQAVNPSRAHPSFFERYVEPPDPSHTGRVWHVSPAIDMAAYHFSWAWVLLPWLFFSSDAVDLYMFALVLGVTLAHRHYGLPYAYLDRGIFHEFKRKLTWFPAVCIVLLAATPLMLMGQDEGSTLSKVAGAMVVLAVVWNIWHTYMQKFGVMRLYLAKEAVSAAKPPGWVDKYFLLCWIPLFFSYLGPHYKTVILDRGHDLESTLIVIIGFLERHETLLMIPSVLMAAGGILTWLWYEWRTQRFGNRARLSAAAGALLISTALFWADPVKAFVAFGFSHAVEYMVFVWAFQRRFYYEPRPAPPLMQRLLAYPRTWYLSFTAIFVGVGFAQYAWGESVNAIPLMGLTVGLWFFYYTVYESLVHFYMDGFLWKMRRREVSAYV